jgi:uncharacterized cupin superfamily protein
MIEPAPVNWDDVTPRRVEVGHLRADWFDLSRAAGSDAVGMRRLRIDPGFFSTPLHVHRSDEETFFVLAGSGLSFQDGASYDVRAGDCIVHRELAEAHTLQAGDEGLDVLAFGVSRETGTGAFLPRSQTIWARPGWVEAAGGKSPFEREADLGPPEATHSSERPASIASLDEIEPHVSERANHRYAWRSLAKRAGAKRTGLNHIALEPGQMGAPPHCHASEEELFVVLEGGGTLLVGNEELAVRPGHVVARPAGTGDAHSFTAGEQGLTFLAYGPWLPDEIVYYPRSNKILFGGIGVMTRVESLDYWDGEE